MRVITDNESNAARRVVVFPIVDDTANAEPWAGSTTGVKALLSVNGGTETPSTADVRRVAGVMHALDLTQSEVNLTHGDLVVGRVPAAAGRREAFFSVVITEVDVTAAGVSDSSIATAVDAALADKFAAIPAATATAVQTQLNDDFAAIPAAVESQLAADFSAIPGAVLADLAGAPGTAARRAIAAEHEGMPKRIVGTPTGVGVELFPYEVDTGAGYVQVGTVRFENGLLKGYD